MVLILLGILRLIFRLVQINSSRLRFQLLNLRMHRYFKRNENMKLVLQKFLFLCENATFITVF